MVSKINQILAGTMAAALFFGSVSETTYSTTKGTQMINKELIELMNRLDTLDDRSRFKALSEVDEQRNELLGILLKHLGTSSSEDVQAAAIFLIGRHRLSDGVSELVHRIDFVAQSHEKSPRAEPLWEKYPAMEALIEIGTPSIRHALELLSTDTNDIRRMLAVKVIRYVEGPDVAAFIMQSASNNARDGNRKLLLDDALARLRKLVQATK